VSGVRVRTVQFAAHAERFYHRRMTVSMIRGCCSAALLIASLMLPATARADDFRGLDAGPLIGPRVTAPTAAEIASATLLRPGSSRKVKVKTADRAPGGLLEADISWSGPGPYSGKIYGSIQDLEADGYCVGAWVWKGDGVHPSLSKGFACPAGEVEPAYYSYKKRWRVLVDVCLVKDNRISYCSGWK
jgi:hypothetical protein